MNNSENLKLVQTTFCIYVNLWIYVCSEYINPNEKCCIDRHVCSSSFPSLMQYHFADELNMRNVSLWLTQFPVFGTPRDSPCMSFDNPPTRTSWFLGVVKKRDSGFHREETSRWSQARGSILNANEGWQSPGSPLKILPSLSIILDTGVH